MRKLGAALAAKEKDMDVALQAHEKLIATTERCVKEAEKRFP